MPSLRTLGAAAMALLASSATAMPNLETRARNRFSFYNLTTALSGPCDLTKGPDGALWGEDILVNKIFRLAPGTHQITEYSLPIMPFPGSNATIPGVSPELQDRLTFSCAIRNGADGNIYAANGLNNVLIRITPKTKAIKVFETNGNPLGNLFPFNDLYSSDDGIYLTQTTGNVFQFFSFKTERFATYQVPTPAALPLGVYVASNKNVYFMELASNKILVFNPSTKNITEVPLPAALQAPAVSRAEYDGWVYFSLFTGNGVGRINMKSNAIELYHTNQTANLGSETTVDKYGGVWLSSFDINAMSRFDAKTLTWSYVTFPATFADAGVNGLPGNVPPYADIAVNYGPGDAIWFTSLIKNQVGRYDISGLYK